MPTLTFRLFGFDHIVKPGFLLFIGVIALFQLQAQTPIESLLSQVVVLTVSLIVHELGHAFAARSYGLRVFPIQLDFMHGLTPHERTTPPRQFFISIAGPAAGFALVALGLLVSVVVPEHPIKFYLVRDIVFFNVIIGLFNLLPILPLDGGNALLSALVTIIGNRRGTLWASGIGIVTGIALAIFGFQSGMFIIAALAAWMTYTNIQVFQHARG